MERSIVPIRRYFVRNETQSLLAQANLRGIQPFSPVAVWGAERDRVAEDWDSEHGLYGMDRTASARTASYRAGSAFSAVVRLAALAALVPDRVQPLEFR